MIADYQRKLQNSELCAGEATLVTIDLRYEFGPITVVMEGVPAFRCTDRDEDLIPGPLGVAISEMATRMANEARAFLDQLRPGSEEPVETTVKFPHHLRELLPA